MRRVHTTRPARIAAGALLVALAAVLSLSLSARPASGAAQDNAERAGIDVVQVQGLLDPPNASLIERSVERAERENAMLLVFQVDSGGAVDVDVPHLVDIVRDATVPIAVWVGPSGGNARSGAALFALSAPYVAVAQGAGIGPVSPVRLDDPDAVGDGAARRAIRDAQRAYGRDDALLDEVMRGRVSALRAEEEGLIDRALPTVGEVIVELDGQTIQTAGGPVELSTARVVGEGEDRRRQPDQQIRFAKLDLTEQLAHTLGTPWVAYFLFVVGGALLVFEFYTVSIGIAGGVGALALVGACYGFSHLPVQWWAVALIVLAMIGFAIDVQATALGAWTFIGAIALVIGSVTLYGGSSRLDPPWWTIALVCAGTVVFMLSGMTAMVRSRFSTPTIGREDLVGELGAAEVGIDPDGVVRIRDALWRARTNRATPIEQGQTVRVVSVRGILLEVEPEEGGARDYRERRH
jgi:membrane-bound serine protease (ClpP class)